MAFWLFLSLIPLAAVAGLVIAKIAAESADVAAMLDTLPPETRNMVDRQLGHVAAWNGGAVGAPAAAVFIWLASGGVHSTFDLLEAKAGVSRPWWKKRLVALGACLGLSIGTAVIAVLSVPRKARKRMPVLPGALLAAALQALLGYGYVFYLSKVGIKSAYQAGLSIIGVTMIALYLFSIALLVGAELNAMLAKKR